MGKAEFMDKFHKAFAGAAAAVLTLVCSQSAHADSFFWAVNQFQTVQKLNGDTGAVVASFAAPAGTVPASIAVVGNTGYIASLGDNRIRAVDVTTGVNFGADLGNAFNITPDGTINGITTDSSGTLWFATVTSLSNYTTSGTLLGNWTFPSVASGYRDGSVVFDGKVITNRGDQQGPYDLFAIPGTNTGMLTLTTPSFINPAINGQTLFGSNGIAFNGVNFYTSDEQAHRVSKWDVNGNFVSFAALDRNSRYENWTFASQDIVPTGGVPEPATWAMMIIGFGAAGSVIRRRKAVVA